jgi:hypothetical protein
MYRIPRSRAGGAPRAGGVQALKVNNVQLEYGPVQMRCSGPTLADYTGIVGVWLELFM